MALRVALILGLVVGLLGCSSEPKIDPSTAEGSYALAAKYEKDERYEEALAQFASVKNKHPYSNLATEAELRIAEIHYKREDFVEAQAAYESFKELHPAYAKIDYVSFRLAMSIYEQLPSTIDRDLSLADKALLYFNEVITSFPKSEHVAASVEHKNKILEMQAKKEIYIGDFYFIREKYDSALGRYQEMMQQFPQSTQYAKALKGAAISSYRLKDNTKANEYLKVLEARFADSKELRETKEVLRAN